MASDARFRATLKSLVAALGSPGSDKESNWLPAPAGDFFLQMRLYEPTDEVLDETYKVPQVIRANR